MSQFPDLFQQGGQPSQVDLGAGSAAILDYPGVALDNILRGRVFDAGLRLGKMAPEDRKSLADRVKQGTGDMPVLGGLIEIALNPWVWAMAGLSAVAPLPTVTQALKPSLRYSSLVRKQAPLLAYFNTADEMLDRSDMLPILDHIEQAAQKYDVLLADRRGVDAARLKLLKGLRDKGIRVSNLTEDRGNDLVKKIDSAIAAKLHGLDQQRTQIRMVATKTDGEVPVRVTLRQVEAPGILDGKKLDDFLREHDAMDLVEEMQTYYNRSIDALFTTNGVPDEDKIMRVIRGMTSGIDGKNIDRLKGTPISDLFDRDVMNWLQTGTKAERAAAENTFRGYIRQMVQHKDYYAPMNTSRIYLKDVDRPLRRVGPEEYDRIFEGKNAPSNRQRGRFGHMMERQHHPNTFDPEDLRVLRDFRNKNFGEAFSKSRSILERRGEEITAGGIYGMPSLSAERAFDKYHSMSRRAYAFDVSQPDDFILKAQVAAREDIKAAIADDTVNYTKKDLDDLLAQPGARYDPPLDGTPARSVIHPATPGLGAPAGGFSNYDALRGSYSFIRDDTTRRYVRDVYMPVITGRQSTKMGALTAAWNNTKGRVNSFMESPVGKELLKDGPQAPMMRRLKQWGEFPLNDPLAVERGLAQFFYSSTLGINLGSVLINMTQPLVTMTRNVKLEDVVVGYKEAFREMRHYATLRSKHFGQHGFTRRGLLIGPEHDAEKMKMVKAAFRYADEAEIGPDIREQMDRMRAPIAKSLRVGPLGKLEDVEQFSMKMFEKGEWFNRSVTAHAAVRAAKRQKIPGFFTKTGELADQGRFTVRQMVRRTQFAADTLNTPTAFLDQTGPMSAIFGNPATRQFFTFPTRMTTGLINGRKFGENGFSEAFITKNPMKFLGSFRDSTRALGMSAIMYEAGKELLGVNLSPATIVGATAGLYRESGPLAPLPAPPIFTLPLSALSAVYEQDLAQMQYTLPTLLPGGVATSRAMGILPRVPGLNALVPIQRSTVDYTQRTEDGRYAVMDPEGRVISYETLPALLARGSGLDMGRFRNEGEMIRYLTNIREEAIDIRRDFMKAWDRNDSGGMRRAKAKFEDKFGMKFSINQRQIESYRQSREVTRAERSLQNLPREFRAKLSPIVGGELGRRLGMDPERFSEALTVKQRDAARAHRAEFTPEQNAIIEDLRRKADQAIPQRVRQNAPFAPFTPFGTPDQADR